MTGERFYVIETWGWCIKPSEHHLQNPPRPQPGVSACVLDRRTCHREAGWFDSETNAGRERARRAARKLCDRLNAEEANA